MQRPISTVNSQVRIDAKDKKILSELLFDSRIPLSRITKEVLLSRDAVSYRLKRLIDKKVISLFYPKINFRKFGFFTYHVFFSLDEIDSQRIEAFKNSLKKNDSVLFVLEYSDKWDFEIGILAKNVEEFDLAITEITKDFSNIVLEKDILEVITTYTANNLPREFVKEKHVKKSHSVNDSKKLDEKDIEILEYLCKNSRASTYDIGGAVKLSNDAVIYRINKMMSSNIIEKFSIFVDYNSLSCFEYVCGIQIKEFDKEHEAKFKEFVNGHPFITKASKTLGIWDILINVVVTNPNDFHRTLKEIKKEFCDIIKDHDVWVAYKLWYFNPLPEVLKKEVLQNK